MTEHQSSRTLVKSAPELWAECSDAASLARHLGTFGEIHITKLEPETAVAWEGAAASGTVRLEPSGWGTRVTLTVTEEAVAPAPEPEVAVEQEPDTAPEPAPRPGMFARLRQSFRRKPPPEPEVLAVGPEPETEAPDVEAVAPQAAPVEASEPAPVAPTGEAALVAALDSLGMAHHRPYSRA
jgi:hypothetical protein